MSTRELETTYGLGMSADPPADAGSRERLTAIVHEHYDFLWRSLRRLGVDEAGLADAAQQVLLVVDRKLRDIALGTEKAFVFGAAIRVASDARRVQARTRSREVSGEEALASVPHPDAGADDLLDDRRARALLDAVLEGMSLDLRAAFVLFELEELTVSEVATILEIPRGTAASRLRRAREEFARIARRVQASHERRGGRT